MTSGYGTQLQKDVRSMAKPKVFLDPEQSGCEADCLDRGLKQRIIGQEEAIHKIVSVYQTFLTGICDPNRPVSNMLFLGPTGSGKTCTVEAVADVLVGNSKNVVKIDCGEFQHSHEVAKLIGSPPGYLGHRETHPLLSQETLDAHHTEKCRLSFVLFDEIEKANDALWNLLLGILDKATLTLGDNRKVDFSRSMIFLTSNLGAKEMQNVVGPQLGFTLNSEKIDNNKVDKAGIAAAKKKFTPEFINRLDEIVVFKSLGSEELRNILSIEIKKVQKRIITLSGHPFVFTLTDGVKEFLLNKGTDVKYGARHLSRTLENYLVRPLANLVASHQVHEGDGLQVDMDTTSQKLTFCREIEDLTPLAMCAILGIVMPPKTQVAEAAATKKTEIKAKAPTSRKA